MAAYVPKSEYETDELKGVIAYGFDALGYRASLEPVQLDKEGGTSVRCVLHNDARPWDSAEGVIIPDGIFQKVEKRGWRGLEDVLTVDEQWLTLRQNQVSALIDKGKWVCFLVRRPAAPAFVREEIGLSRRILDRYSIRRVYARVSAGAQGAQPEFREYLHKHGPAQARFLMPGTKAMDCRTIAEVDGSIVALELGRSVFFLPFHPQPKEGEGALGVARQLAEAMTKYRERLRDEVPAWTDAFSFSDEKKVRGELDTAQNEVARLESELQNWRSHKRMLATQSDPLRQCILDVLEHFFGLRVDRRDNKKEDARILSDAGAITAFVEVRGTKSDVHDEDVAQVDTNRMRSGETEATAGVLFINPNMSIRTIEGRLARAIDAKQVCYARKKNVLIMRTVDLLHLMKTCEGKVKHERRASLLGFLQQGGGWLRFDETGHGPSLDQGV